MLHSMTGFGIANVRRDGVTVTTEVKTVNNRYLKLAIRVTDGYGVLESRVESQLRKAIQRGVINVTVRIRHDGCGPVSRIYQDTLLAYYHEFQAIGKLLGIVEPVSFDALLRLPGVIQDDSVIDEEMVETVWNIVQQSLTESLDKMQQMRVAEGESMRHDLEANLKQVEIAVSDVEVQAPQVAEQYRHRLSERISKILHDHKLSLSSSDLVREVAFFADRCDISEEIVRLKSHLSQFRNTMAMAESCGRKLDFLTQELLREANTIGSKSNDATITSCVVEIKAIIERIREMVQNIE